MNPSARVIALTAIFSSPLPAQAPHATHRGFMVGVHLSLPTARPTPPTFPLCDGSEMAGVQSRRHFGSLLFLGGLATILVAPEFVRGTDPSTATTLMSAGAIASGVGVYLRYNSNPSDAFWQSSVSQIKVGETRAEDVHQCLGNPSATMSSGAEATWTYTMAKTGFLGLGGSARSVSITLRDGLVSKVQKSEFGF